MVPATGFTVHCWATEPTEIFRMQSMRQIAGLPQYVTPYFSTEGGAFAWGMIGYRDGELWGIRPSTRFNPRLMRMLLDWQTQGISRLRHWSAGETDEWVNLLSEQDFIVKAMWIAGTALLDCRADSELTELIAKGLVEIRARILGPDPFAVSEAITFFETLLTGIACLADRPSSG